jgi:hypothetical protein
MVILNVFANLAFIFIGMLTIVFHRKIAAFMHWLNKKLFVNVSLEQLNISYLLSGIVLIVYGIVMLIRKWMNS